MLLSVVWKFAQRGKCMNYSKINLCDIANGPGVRVSLFVSGCRNHCKNCFNPETWDFANGEPFDEKAEKIIIDGLKPDYIMGFTLLGGEPFEPENAAVLAPFVQKLRERYPKKSFWCFSGNDLEYLLSGKKGDVAPIKTILQNMDVLVDGRFVEELKNLQLRFRGSSNQRVILLKPTLESGKVVLWDEVTVI